MHSTEDHNMAHTCELKSKLPSHTSNDIFHTATCSTKALKQALYTILSYLNSAEEKSDNILLKFGKISLYLQIKNPIVPQKSLIAEEISRTLPEILGSSNSLFYSSPSDSDFLQELLLDFNEHLFENSEFQQKVTQDIFSNQDYIDSFIHSENEIINRKKNSFGNSQTVEDLELEKNLKEVEKKLNIKSKNFQMFIEKVVKETEVTIEKFEKYANENQIERSIDEKIKDIKSEIDELCIQLSAVDDTLDREAVLMEINRKNTKLNELRSQNALKLSLIRRKGYSKIIDSPSNRRHSKHLSLNNFGNNASGGSLKESYQKVCGENQFPKIYGESIISKISRESPILKSYVDSPRAQNPQDSQDTQEIMKEISNFCSVLVNFKEKVLGLSESLLKSSN